MFKKSLECPMESRNVSRNEFRASMKSRGV